MRDLSPNFAAAVASSTVTPALLCHLDFAGDPLHAWTGIGSLSWAGETWQGLGSFAGIEPIEEYSEVRAGSVGLQISHVPNHLLSSVKDIGFKRRAAEVWLALFAGDSAELIGVELLLRGTMDVLTISRQPEESTLRVTVANELSRLKHNWGSLYTDSHQRSQFPNDTGLRFVASMQDLNIRI